MKKAQYEQIRTNTLSSIFIVVTCKILIVNNTNVTSEFAGNVPKVLPHHHMLGPLPLWTVTCRARTARMFDDPLGSVSTFDAVVNHHPPHHHPTNQRATIAIPTSGFCK